MKSLQNKKQQQAGFIYLVLAALFIASLVTCNLIANKFVKVDMGFHVFQVSAGVLPYPITFLITDILSEIYGRQRTNQVVLAGFFSTLLVLGILYVGHNFPAIESSPVSEQDYSSVFQNSWKIIMASMVAYLAAQFLDIRIFHFWKRVTKGKHLWLRNNFSTVISQLVDTTLVVSIIFIGVAEVSFITGLIADGWLFKILFALADTALIYPIVIGFRKYFELEPGEELDF
ncbi:queuosine precursor transporter [Owenweeksia hongkongensis]|uniref:queuosine precursor transporter n=1 Tax=Owenweeksia hongkongensis TaxID=253245 RepID=UPI003A8EE83F